MIIKSIDVYMNNNLYGVIVIFVCRIYVLKNFLFIKLIDFKGKNVFCVWRKKIYKINDVYVYCKCNIDLIKKI